MLFESIGLQNGVICKITLYLTTMLYINGAKCDGFYVCLFFGLNFARFTFVFGFDFYEA